MTTPNFNRMQKKANELSLDHAASENMKLSCFPENTIDATSISTNILKEQDNESIPNKLFKDNMQKKATI